ncbi:hypothetical protein N9051_01425 [Akkermansiaceae bacterium]|nr:hypothetical protein [Akkermansiaceae bacterium]
MDFCKNITAGYGSESQSFADLIPGDYEFSARFYGDWRDNDMSTATAELEVIRHFGTPKETRERHAIRLTEKETKTIVTIEKVESNSMREECDALITLPEAAAEENQHRNIF